MVSFAAAKQHCRVDHDDDDAVIERMIAAASDHLASVDVDMSKPMKPAVEQAMLMLVSHWYENREAVLDVKTAAVDIGVDRLIQPYREVSL